MIKPLVVALMALIYLNRFYLATRFLYSHDIDPEIIDEHMKNNPDLSPCNCQYNKTLIKEYKIEIRNMKWALEKLQFHEENNIKYFHSLLKYVTSTVENLPHRMQIYYFQELRTFQNTFEEVLRREDALRNNIQVRIRHVESKHRTISTTPKEVHLKRTHFGPIFPQSCRLYNGIYKVQIPTYKLPFSVACDYETQNGNWLVIQRRENGFVDFRRSWNEYKEGFGNITGEFWIGLEKIHALTSHQNYELLIVMKDFDNVYHNASYDAFEIASEREGYRLKVLGNYTGDAGDALSEHQGYKFSTFDKDQDIYKNTHCAEFFASGWWHKDCSFSNPNGQYLSGVVSSKTKNKGVVWHTLLKNYSLKFVEMMIRPSHSTKFIFV